MAEPASVYKALRAQGYLQGVSFPAFLAGVPIASDDNPQHGFAGSPYHKVSGTYGGILAAPLTRYAQRFGKAYDITGASMDELVQHVMAGEPVAVWVTRNFEAPRTLHRYYGTVVSPGHTMTLVGYDAASRKLKVADPNARGQYWVDWGTFARSYDIMKMAIVVKK